MGLDAERNPGKLTGYVEVDIEAKKGSKKAEIALAMEWDALSMQLLKASGEAVGPPVPVWTPPKTTVQFSGGVEFLPAEQRLSGWLQVEGFVNVLFGYGFSVGLKISGEAGPVPEYELVPITLTISGKPWPFWQVQPTGNAPVKLSKLEGELWMTAGPLTGTLIFTFTPKGPGDAYYEVWNIYGEVGYELDFGCWGFICGGYWSDRVAITNFDVGG